MEILNNNIDLLTKLNAQYPESFQDIIITGNKIIFNNESLDISSVNLYDVLTNENISASLGTLKSEDIFKIIKINVTLKNSLNDSKNNKSEKEENKKDNKSNLEKLKRIDSTMNNISIVTKVNDGVKEEYFNIVDSDGQNHLFNNRYNIDIVEFYSFLKTKYGDNSLTPETLIFEVKSRLPEISLEKSSNIIDNDNHGEDFQNTIGLLDEKYKDNKLKSIQGNEETGISIVSDVNDPNNREIYTYERNKYGDLVSVEHNQNRNENIVNDEQVKEVNEDSNESEIIEEKKNNIEVTLIPEQRFYAYLASSQEFDDLQRNQVNLYYSFFADCMLYQDYLETEIVEMLRRFENYIWSIAQEGNELTIHQTEAIQKYQEMAEQKEKKENISNEMVVENVKELKLVYDNRNQNAAFVSTLEVVWIIIGVAIILTAITLYIIG